MSVLPIRGRQIINTTIENSETTFSHLGQIRVKVEKTVLVMSY